MKSLLLALTVVAITSFPVNAKDGQTAMQKLIEDTIADIKAAKKRDASRKPDERPAVERFAEDARKLNRRFADLWLHVFMNERLANDYGVTPDANKIRSYTEQLSGLTRERGQLEGRMATEQLDVRDCWPDHDFVAGNYIAPSRNVLQKFSEMLGDGKASSDDGRIKAIRAVDAIAASCRSLIAALQPRLERDATEPRSADDLLDIHQMLTEFSFAVREVDTMVEALGLKFSDAFPDRDKLIETERHLVQTWQAETKRATAAGLSTGELIFASQTPWRRPKLLAEQANRVIDQRLGDVDTVPRKSFATSQQPTGSPIKSTNTVVIAICCLSGAGTLYLLTRLYAQTALRRAERDALRRCTSDVAFCLPPSSRESTCDMPVSLTVKKVS